MPAMDLEIGRDTLLALSAIAWADGKLTQEEAAGIRHAAEQLGLTGNDVTLLERSLAEPYSLEAVETVRMSRSTRLFTYAAASWVLTLDGDVSPPEREALQLLGDRLGLSDVARERAISAADDVARQTARGSRYDFMRLRSQLESRLADIGDV